MPLSQALKRVLNWSGSAIAILSIFFVAERLRDFGTKIDFSSFSLSMLWVIGGLALVYGASNLMLAIAWRHLLAQFGASTSLRWASVAYGMSQFAKYVPGNIFHLAGRQAIGMAAGIAGWPLAKSTLWELGSIATAGAVFSLLTLPLIVKGLPVIVGMGGFISSVIFLTILLWRLIGLPVAHAFIWQTIFLTVSGCLFLALLMILSEEHALGYALWLPLVGAYVLAWLAGLMTPGAPAGVGVRELVLLFLLNGIVSEAELLLAVLLGRLITVAGDFFYFLTSGLLKFMDMR